MTDDTLTKRCMRQEYRAEGKVLDCGVPGRKSQGEQL